MTTIAIVPENPGNSQTQFRAVAGKMQAVGKTAGEALDELNAQLNETENGTLVVVQHRHPDVFFGAEQQKRLMELMERWRKAREGRTTLPSAEQSELEALVVAETAAAGARAAALVRGLTP